MAVFRDDSGRRARRIGWAMALFWLMVVAWFIGFLHSVMGGWSVVGGWPAIRPSERKGADVQIEGEGELFKLDQQSAVTRILRSGGPANGRVALSFDDGPDPEATPAILDLLRARGLHAAFFVIGEQALAHPELLRRIRDEGHLIGNHTFTHPDLALVSPLRFALELGLVQRALAAALGEAPRLFRPPFHADGALDDPARRRALALALGHGLLGLGQDVDSDDFRGGDAREIAARTLERAAASGGGLVLFHDGGGDRTATIAALPLLLDGLAARGLTAVDAHSLAGFASARDAFVPQQASFSERIFFRIWAGLAGLWATFFGAALALLSLRTLGLGAAALLQLRRRPLWPDTSALRVSAVVPAYNEEVGAVRTVESLLAQAPPLAEILCIDDGSTDRTLAVLRARFHDEPRVRVLTQRNGGKSSALVRGFAEATGEIVIALDGDTLFAPGAVAALTAPFGDPEVAAVAGNAKVGNRVTSVARMQALEYITAQNLERRAWDLLGAVPCVPGAVGAWRKRCVLEAGGFTDDTLAEDTDLTLRLIAAGHRVVYAEDALAFTEAPETARALHKQRFRWTFGVLQAAWKHRARVLRAGSGTLGWLLLPSIALFQIAVPLLAPLVDLLALLSLARGDVSVLVPFALFLALDATVCAIALRLDREDPSLLLLVPLQRLVFRWVLWRALAQALASALTGTTVGWGKLARTGSVSIATLPAAA